MIKPRTVCEIQAFEKIYPRLKRRIAELQKKDKKRRLRFYSWYDRIMVNRDYLYNLAVLGVSLVLAVIIILILTLLRFDRDNAVIWALIIWTPLLPALMFWGEWRTNRFRLGYTGEHKFYLMAKWFKEEYEQKSFSITSLQLALEQQISTMNWYIACIVGVASGLILYLEIDSSFFEGSKPLHALCSLSPVHGCETFLRWLIAILFWATSICSFIYFRAKKTQVEQIKVFLDYLIKHDQ